MSTEIKKPDRVMEQQFGRALCSVTGWAAVDCPVCVVAKRVGCLHFMGTPLGTVAYVKADTNAERNALVALLGRTTH